MPQPLKLTKKPLSAREQVKRNQIIDKAIAFFAENGIGDTKVDDIIRFLEIGKGTLYRYFENKKDLQLHCIARLTTIIVPQEVLDEIDQEDDYRIRLKKRFIAFLKGFPKFSGILSLANQGLHSNDADLASQAKETYRTFAHPLIRDFLSDKKKSLMRDIDEESTAYLILGMGESMGRLLKINPTRTPEQLVEWALEFVIKGLYLDEEDTRDQELCGVYWNVRDRENYTERVHNLAFNDKEHFFGEAGKWELQIPLMNIASIGLQRGGDESFSASVLLRNDQSHMLAVDGNTILSGDTGFGRCCIKLRELVSIGLVPYDETEPES